ncbi:MAG: flagellar protein FlbB [Treponema sp.]|nr:flagellar protein FlbB [Treponema sp.]
MARGSNIGKSIVLLFLIIILCLGGLLWFDYLGIIHAKTVFAPVYRLFGREAQTAPTATSSRPLNSDIDQDRIDKQREALQLYKEELEKRETDLTATGQQNEQLAAELAEREKILEEREKTFNNLQKRYDDVEVNIEQIAANLYNMRPEAAVEILVAMDDQLVIDVLRKEDETAKTRSDGYSMSSYWLSLMPAERAATVQRKMVSKPRVLD